MTEPIPIAKNRAKYKVGEDGTEEIFSPIAEPSISGETEFFIRARMLNRLIKNPNIIKASLGLIFYFFLVFSVFIYVVSI